MRLPDVAGSARLSPNDRRALSLGLVVLATALSTRLGVIPYFRARSETRAQVERERDLFRREQALLTAVRAYPQREERAGAALLREAPRLFGGADLGTASAALVNYVGTSATRHRVFVQQNATRPPEAAGSGVARLQVDLRAVGDLEGILALLQDWESGPKLLTVDHLAIAQAERVGIGEPRDEEVLGMSATVSGYALGDSDTSTTAPSLTARGQVP